MIWNGGVKYQVTGAWGDQCVVNVQDKVCTCRKWELTGIPCRHAVAACWNMGLNAIEVGPPESWVHSCYWLSTWKEVYSHLVEPIRGSNYWEKTTHAIELLPPKHHVQVGRPKKKRRRSKYEDAPCVDSGKLTKRGRVITCRLCGNAGHNKTTCKGQGQPPRKGSYYIFIVMFFYCFKFGTFFNLFSYVGFNKSGARQPKGNGSAHAGPSSAVQGGDVAAEAGPRSSVQGVSGASQAGPSSSV